jgi:hypothetical protein
VTRFEQIAAAFPLHCQRIAEATFQHCGDTRLLTDQSDDFDLKQGAGAILQASFLWDHTAEGHNYWSALRHGARSTDCRPETEHLS